MAADATIQGLRATLEEERDSLRRQLVELGHGAKGLDYDPNFADSSQVTAERGENEALVNKLVEGLREVEHALSKLGTDVVWRLRELRPAHRPGPPGGQARGPAVYRLRRRRRQPAIVQPDTTGPAEQHQHYTAG